MREMSHSPAGLAVPVESVMTRRIVQIIEQIPMSEVRNVAAKYDYNGFPVVTPEGRLVGMITKGDLLRVACAALDDPAVWEQPVSRFMAHGVLALRPMDSLRSAVQYMVESKLRSLPVIDAECRVLGMVSRNDLMVAIAPEAV
jgi:CBS-domain-containing membrane protein